ncbi:hypothetical protein HY224_02175 [Candidatus Uhrbacteria bacterium]|nr:hypothetical protein [Candidatus Uhrbacteria bacterium]
MSTLSQQCLNCKTKFDILPEHLAYYEKLKVPAPTWCPDCRQKRRYAWRNERVLYRRNCDLCRKNIVTIYSPNKPFKVYCPECWWSDKWSALDAGQDFDFSQPFFPQWQKMQLKIPRIALLTKNSTNSDYTNHANNNKSCYMSFGVMDSENMLYCTNIWKESRDSVDCYLGNNEGGAELAYQCVDSSKIYKCQFGNLLKNCNDCFYCYDMRGCSNCFLSYNLRNKQYCFLNKQYTPEEYKKLVDQYHLGSFSVREELLKKYSEVVASQAVHRYAQIENSTNATGNVISRSKNAIYMFDADETEDCAYSIVVPDVKDTLDAYHVGFDTELVYDSHALIHCYNVHFSHLSYHNSNLEYCDGCHNSENLFACVGLRKNSYCIFNKQYSEAEYQKSRQKIVDHMIKTGEYGQFFPAQLSPFGYNETTGATYMPMTKDEVLRSGWKWEDLVPGTFGKETVKPGQMVDQIKDVPDAALKDIFACVRCQKDYTVIKPELDFYRSQNIPLPRQCPDCRYKGLISRRLPRKLWGRSCNCSGQGLEGRHKNSNEHFHGSSKCPNKFETAYAPDRPEIIYCEACYQKEII